MPLEEGILSRGTDGSINEAYCRWCYIGGEFVCKDMESLIDFCAGHMASDAWQEK